LTDENGTYYVVEYRLPVQVNKAASPSDAAAKAAKEIEKRFKFTPSAWFARVFKYDSENVGPVAEYFASPGGTKFRDVTKNIKKVGHEDNPISRPQDKEE